MSSIFVYNSKGVIDEQAINQLILATHVSEMISYKLSENEEENMRETNISSITPNFVWLLRDFHLSIIDQDKNSISTTQYMENILQTSKVHSRNGEKSAEIRKNFLKTFKNRFCFTLPRPVDQESDLLILNTLTLESLRPKFLKSFKKFEKFLLENCPLKVLKNVEINGKQLFFFIEEIIKSINDGILPNLHTAWNEVIRRQYEEYLKEAKLIYIESRNILIENMPYEDIELTNKFQSAKANALNIFTQIGQIDNLYEEYIKEEFEIFYNIENQIIINMNNSASETYNISVINQILKNIIKDAKEGFYNEHFEDFERDWNKKIKEYETLAKGPIKTLAVSEYSKIYQNIVFTKLQQDTADHEAEALRKEHKKYQDELSEKLKISKEELIKASVSNR